MNEQTGKRNAHKHSSRSSLTVCVVFGLGRRWRGKKKKPSKFQHCTDVRARKREDFVDSKKSREREREILRRLNIISITFCLDNNRWSIHRVKASVTVSPWSDDSALAPDAVRSTSCLCVCVLFTAFHKTVPGATDLLCTNALNYIYVII